MALSPDRRQALSRGLVELAGPAGSAARARTLARTAAEAFSTGAVVLLLASGEQIEALAGSDDGCRALAERERDAGIGPGLACVRSGGLLTLDLRAPAESPGPAADTPWSRSAALLGWSRADAVPLQAGDRPVGALVLLSRPGLEPDGSDLAWALTLAGVAAAGLGQDRALAEARTVTAQLETALQSRIVIEQAKGMLAERGGIDPGTAFTRMRRHARARRQALRDVALDVLGGTAADAVLAFADPAPRGARRPGGGPEPPGGRAGGDS